MSASFPPRVGRVGEGLFVGREVDGRGPRLLWWVYKRGIHDCDLYDVFIQDLLVRLGIKYIILSILRLYNTDYTICITNNFL